MFNKVCPICKEEFGILSWLLSNKYNNHLFYCKLDKAKEENRKVDEYVSSITRPNTYHRNPTTSLNPAIGGSVNPYLYRDLGNSCCLDLCDSICITPLDDTPSFVIGGSFDGGGASDSWDSSNSSSSSSSSDD
jgi:hypothetical protein